MYILVYLTLLRGTVAAAYRCTSCHQQGHVDNKTLVQQNPEVLN